MTKEDVQKVSKPVDRVTLVRHVYLGRITFEEAMTKLISNHIRDKKPA